MYVPNNQVCGNHWNTLLAFPDDFSNIMKSFQLQDVTLNVVWDSKRNILLGETFDVHDMPQCKVGGSNHTSVEPVVHDPLSVPILKLDTLNWMETRSCGATLDKSNWKVTYRNCYSATSTETIVARFLKDLPLFQLCPDVGVLADEFHQTIGML